MLVTRAVTLAMLLAGLGCGPTAGEPRDWMIGVFSSHVEGIGQNIGEDAFVARYYFHEDRSFRYEAVRDCGASSWVQEDLTWVEESETRVRVALPDTWTASALVLERLSDCDAFQVIEEVEGGSGLGEPVHRGEICLAVYTCPDAEGMDVECGCRRSYCEERPAPLDCAR